MAKLEYSGGGFDLKIDYVVNGPLSVFSGSLRIAIERTLELHKIIPLKDFTVAKVVDDHYLYLFEALDGRIWTQHIYLADLSTEITIPGRWLLAELAAHTGAREAMMVFIKEHTLTEFKMEFNP